MNLPRQILGAFGLAMALVAAATGHTTAQAQDFGPVTLEPAPRPPHPQLQVGGAIGVPSFVTTDSDFASTGVGLSGRLGFDMGYVVPELYVGWQWHSIDVGSSFQEEMYRNYFAVGVRGEAENRSPVTPYLGGTLDFNWWSLSFEDTLVCGIYYCVEERTYHFTPGFTLRGGAAIRVGPHVSIDLGLEAGLTFEGRVFNEPEMWLGPTFGLTGYFY